MKNNRQNHGAREFFTLGEHTVGSKQYRFRYDGRIYRILEHLIPSNPTSQEEAAEVQETLVLEEADSRKAYDAWNHIKRPERFGSA